MKIQSNRGTSRRFDAVCAGACVVLVMNTLPVRAAHAQTPVPNAPSTVAKAVQSATTPASDAGGRALPAGTLAIVNGVPLAQAQLDDAMRNIRQPDTPQLRDAVKQDLVLRELLRQKAEEAHYDLKPEVETAIRATKINAETQLYLRDNVHPEPVTDEQVKARYDEIVASLGQQEYKSRIISLADDATAAQVLAQIKKGASFDALARQYSVAPSKSSGGEMDWVNFKTPPVEGKTRGIPLPIAEALSRLAIGGITQTPVALGNVRVILRLEGKRATQVPTYEQLKDTIRQQSQAAAFQKALAAFSAALLKGATVVQ